MSEDDGDIGGGPWVYLDIYCGDMRVERLAMQEGDEFHAEVDCDDYWIDVVSIKDE